MSARLAALAMVVLAATGCRSSRDAPPDPGEGPPPLTESERELGTKACNDYQARVCACAESRAELAADCRMAGSRLEALELSSNVSIAEGTSAADRAAALGNARQIIRRCVEQSAELAKTCSD